MNNEPNREDQALDALIAAAFRQADCGDLTSGELLRLEKSLSAEDLQALEDLGEDIVDKVINGQLDTGKDSPEAKMHESPEEELAGAMHRGEDDLTDAAREEMEQKLRELEEDEGEQEDDSKRN